MPRALIDWPPGAAVAVGGLVMLALTGCRALEPAGIAARNEGAVARAHAILTVAESKRLIAKGIARAPAVRSALENGMVIVCRGTTNTYVAEELLGRPVPHGAFVLGRVTPEKGGRAIPKVDPMPEVVIIRGRHRPDVTLAQALERLSAGDVILKGGNALDYPRRRATVWTSGADGGTVGRILPRIEATGARLIIPIGLEKQVSGSVEEIARRLGGPAEPLTDMPRMRILPGEVFTEIEALKVLADVDAFQASAGGVAGAEGAVWLVWEGRRECVERARQIVASIQGEKPFADP